MSIRKTGVDLYKAVSSNTTSKNDSDIDHVSRKPRIEEEGFLKIAGEKGLSKAARLLLLLGPEHASRVMANMTDAEAELLAREIAHCSRIDTVEARNILSDFGMSFEVSQDRTRGGVDAARRILSGAFGEDSAESILRKAVPEVRPKPFAFLDDLDFPQVAALLRKESVPTLSLILSRLEPALASKLVESLPEPQRVAVVLRMAKGEKVSHDILDTVETTLKEKVRHIGATGAEDVDGRAALAGILRFMSLEDERRILDELGEVDPTLADEVKEKLFTMDTVLHMDNRDLQHALKDLPERDIALVLKGQEEQIRERFMACLSTRRRLLVKDESDIMGPVRKSEADQAAKAFLELLRSREEDGTYLILREEEDLIE